MLMRTMDYSATPIDYRKQDFVEVVAEKTAGKGVAAVFDAVGVDNFKRSYQSLSESRYLVVYGMYTTSLQADVGDMLSMALLSNQKLKPTISQVLPLKDAAQAHRLIEAGGVRGKLVLKVAD